MSISAKDSVGSRIRCIQLSDLIKDNPKLLEKLVALPNVKVPQSPSILPCGMGKPEELVFNKPISKEFIEKLMEYNPNVGFKSYDDFKKKIESWWLIHPGNANTPNWDLACLANIDGNYGMILVEAKAHVGEMSRSHKIENTGSKKSQENHKRIGEAIGEASKNLGCYSDLKFNLSLESPYQLSNRFAWSWKLADLKIPVVLVYLGFLDAAEMDKKLFESHTDVVGCVKEICRKTKKADSNVYIPEAAWSDKPITNDKGINIYSVIRSMDLTIGKAKIKSINNELIH